MVAVDKPRSPRVHHGALLTPYLAFLASAVGVISYHEATIVETGVVPLLLSQRLAAGPTALLPLDRLLFGVLILLAFELLDYITNHSGIWMHSKLIPVRGKHLDELSVKDRVFVGISKAQTAPFVYCYLRFCFGEANMVWDFQQIPWLSTVLLPLPLLFVVYDFFYTLLHWALHIKAVYGYVHKHHHHQKAPSRANVDAVNVHPLEFFLGEYNHLLALFLVTRLAQVHIITAVLFLAIGGILAGWNHTRFDISWTILGVKVFDTKAHDVHHRLPQSNYGQYIMLWDYVFGTYRAYNPSDRVNPAAQLDPVTGKTIVPRAAATNGSSQ